MSPPVDEWGVRSEVAQLPSGLHDSLQRCVIGAHVGYDYE